MAYRYYSRRRAKRLARKSKKNLVITIILIAALLYVTINWILPNFIGGLTFLTGMLKSSPKVATQKEEPHSAPPVLIIPYEATNSSKININGYATPNSKVRLYIDDDLKKEVKSLSDGSFEFVDVTLSAGTNNIYGKTVDEKNVESLPSKTLRVFYDNEKPTLEVYEPEDGKNIQGERKIKISGITELQASVYINGGQVIVDKEGKFESIQTLNDGENTFTIKSQDAAGNFTEIQRRVTFQP